MDIHNTILEVSVCGCSYGLGSSSNLILCSQIYMRVFAGGGVGNPQHHPGGECVWMLLWSWLFIKFNPLVTIEPMSFSLSKNHLKREHPWFFFIKSDFFSSFDPDQPIISLFPVIGNPPIISMETRSFIAVLFQSLNEEMEV